MASDEKKKTVNEQFDEFVEKAQHDLPAEGRSYYSPEIGIGNALLAVAIAIRGLWKDNP